MAFNKETPTGSVVIQNESFDIPRPFLEGYVCTNADASVLNQVLGENTRNNFADRVKKAKEAATDEAPFNKKKMKAEIDEYLETYEFGVRRGRGPADPVEREALNIAKDIVKNAIREKGMKLGDIDVENINKLAEQVVAENPDVTKEAKRRVDQRNKMTAGELDLSSVAA